MTDCYIHERKNVAEKKFSETWFRFLLYVKFPVYDTRGVQYVPKQFCMSVVI